MILKPKQEVEWKRKWFCGVKLIHFNFKVKWENAVWAEICFLPWERIAATLIQLLMKIWKTFCWQGMNEKWKNKSNFLAAKFFLQGTSFLFSQWKFFELYFRTCPAVFWFRRRDFCYDHMTSQPLQICFLVIRSCNFNWSACVTSFFAPSGVRFFVHLRDKIWSDLTYLTHKNDFLTLKLTLIQRDKVKWVYVTLSEVY